jgi:large repetitive protein
VLVTATDIANNDAIHIVTLTAKDVTPPVLTAAANQNVNLDAGCSITVPNVTGSATDNCTGVTITQSPIAGTTVSAVHDGTYSVTVTATDLAGLTATSVVVITAKDVTAPVLTAAANQDVTLDGGCMITVPNVTGSASDNCSGTTITQSPMATSTLAAVHNGTYSVTVTATDLGGNTATSIVVLTAKDQTAPTITTCPSAVTNVPTNAAGCHATLASVSLGTPIATDNCSIVSTTNNAPSLFPVGTTTVTWTVTDAGGNTATCTQTVTVVNNLIATIGGTATVGQNLTTTSNISFSGTGGTLPYTFVYTNAAGTSTISTTGINTLTTVPQSNAVVGTYSYTLNSMTDANGCPAALPIAPANMQVITVVTGLPDFTPTIDMDGLGFAAAGTAIDFVVNINEIKNFPNNGALKFRVVQPTSLDITFATTSGTSNVFGGTANNNGDWIITKAGSIITCELKSTASISGFGVSAVGFTATRKTGVAKNTTGNITASINAGTGGDSVNGNNVIVIQTVAQ